MTRCGKIFGMAVVTVTLVAAAIFAGNVGQGNGKEDVVYASGAMTCDVATPTDPVPEVKNGWYIEEGRSYYYQDDVKLTSKLITQTETTGETKVNYVYYLGADGAACTGFKRVNGKLYYFSDTNTKHPCAAVRGWQEINGKTYYFSRVNLNAVSGLVMLGGNRYYFNPTTNVMATGLTKVGTDKMYFSKKTGAAVISKKMKIGDYYYYFCSNGRALKSILFNYDNHTYYASASGVLKTGFFTAGGYKFYANSYAHILRNSFKTINGKTYYFGSNGKAVKGLRQIGGYKYYFDTYCVMKKSSFLKTGKGTYYFGASGKAVKGLNRIGNYRYYFTSDNKMLRNSWKKIDGRTYYFGDSGKAYTGVRRVKGYSNLFNFSSGGYLTGGFRKVYGKTYLFAKNGKPYVGWYTTGNGNRQYYRSNGRACTGPNVVGGKLYLFDERGVLIKSPGWYKTKKGNKYYVKKDGTLLTGYRYIDGENYYFAKTGTMYKSRWAYAEGFKYYFGKDGKRLIDVDAIIGPQERYEITIDKATNVVTIYAQDGDKGFIIPVKAFICSTGETTPVGTFYTPGKWRWLTLMGPCYGQWDTLITGDILFHSVYYDKEDPTTLSVSAYNMLGTMCSHGCVRLTARDAKWIYDYCVLGTKVTIYESGAKQPFPKPTSIHLEYYHSWDPTDPTMEYRCKELGCH